VGAPCDGWRMAHTASNQDLGECIERLVQEHIAASRKTAQQAVERAFGLGAVVPSGTRRGSRTSASGSSKRRSPEEIAAQGECLYQAVCAKPGETMTVLMADVGGSARELQRPMALLKLAGRVRSVGARHLTRYFPMVNEAAASA